MEIKKLFLHHVRNCKNSLKYIHHSNNMLHLAKYLKKNVKTKAPLSRCLQTAKKDLFLYKKVKKQRPFA